jgi:hypothetical protein
MSPEDQQRFDQFMAGAGQLQGFDQGGYYQQGVNTPQDPGQNSAAWNGFLDYLRQQGVIGTSFNDPYQMEPVESEYILIWAGLVVATQQSVQYGGTASVAGRRLE